MGKQVLVVETAQITLGSMVVLILAVFYRWLAIHHDGHQRQCFDEGKWGCLMGFHTILSIYDAKWSCTYLY